LKPSDSLSESASSLPFSTHGELLDGELLDGELLDVELLDVELLDGLLSVRALFFGGEKKAVGSLCSLASTIPHQYAWSLYTTLLTP